MCTRALWPDAAGAVLVGRSMDWAVDTGTNLWAFPRGMERDDGIDGTLAWRSDYGSLVASGYDLLSVDGINDGGLAAHQLFLPESHYGELDGSRPALSVAVWMQYVMDKFETVAEAVAWLEESQLAIAAQADPATGRSVTLHLALEDASGDSAIVEYLDGTPRIHHGREYTVMTNSPPFDEQLERLRELEGFGGDRPLPGGTDADQRFARAAFYLRRLPAPQSTSEAVASLLSVMRNASQPFREPDPDKPYASQTQWRTLADLTHGVYVFESAHHPNIVWVRLSALDLSDGAPARKLELVADTGLEGGLVGDVSDRFEVAVAMRFQPVG